MKKLLTILGLTLPFFAIAVNPAHAASSDVTQYTSNTLGMITLIATASAVFFIGTDSRQQTVLMMALNNVLVTVFVSSSYL